MRFSTVALALAALSIESAVAGAAGHRHAAMHRRKAAESAPMVKRVPNLSDSGLSRLQTLGFGSQGVPANGVNAVAPGTSGVWIGEDGTYTNVFKNNATEEIILVVWGAEPAFQASFPMAVQPLITAAIAPSESLTLSFAEGQSGAWAPVYPDTVMSTWGQIHQTWGEFTMSPSGVVDVSREVYMDGNPMTIIGPSCTTDMDRCVFKCHSGTTCGEAGTYSLINCAPGSQPGANISPAGIDGGCGWPGATTVALETIFS